MNAQAIVPKGNVSVNFRQQLLSFLNDRYLRITLTSVILQPFPSVPLQGAGIPPGGIHGGSAEHRVDLKDYSNEIYQVAQYEGPVTLTLASFAVTRKPFGKIVRKFCREYKEETGKTVKFRLSFSGSGTQARAIIDGLPADIAALALPLDILKIEEAGLIKPGWQKRFQYDSVPYESVVSLVVRHGNPKKVTSWEDLARDDISIVMANPKTAGVARWIFLALWGHKLSRGDDAAYKFVEKVFQNVETMPRDAREASDVFYNQRMGDVLLTYENEAIFTNKMVCPDNPMPIISPDNNVKIVCPIALIDKNLDGKGEEHVKAAEAFVRSLFQPAAQQEFAATGFRSPNNKALTESMGVTKLKKLWEVEKRLGPWPKVQAKFFDEGGILGTVLSSVSTSKIEKRNREVRSQ